MKECTIRRYNFSGKWLELWLDGLEYTSDETKWDDTTQTSIPTGDKQWNYCDKRGYFERDYKNAFGEYPDYPNIIGLKVFVEEDTIIFVKKPLEIKSLRLGNLISDYDGNIGEVSFIDKERIRVNDESIGFSDLNYKPIPLTEQWLLDFGLSGKHITPILKTIDVSDNDKSVEIEFNAGVFDLWISSDSIDEALYCPLKHIKYVHQFQNLYFALTGEELTKNNHPL